MNSFNKELNVGAFLFCPAGFTGFKAVIIPISTSHTTIANIILIRAEYLYKPCGSTTTFEGIWAKLDFPKLPFFRIVYKNLNSCHSYLLLRNYYNRIRMNAIVNTRMLYHSALDFETWFQTLL